MDGRSVRIWLDVTIAWDADPETVADNLFELASTDPEDVCPEIETVCNSGWEE